MVEPWLEIMEFLAPNFEFEQVLNITLVVLNTIIALSVFGSMILWAQNYEFHFFLLL